MSQTRLDIELSLRSSLVIGADGESTLYTQTRDYVPGAALRGALADTLISEGAKAEFDALFGDLAAEPIFYNLYPSRAGSPSYPLPLSARSCKYHRGFLSQEGEHHGVGDILIRQAVFEALIGDRVPLPALYEPRCPACHGDVDVLPGGYYEYVGGGYEPARAPVRRTSRTAIDRRRATAAEQMLYTLEMVEPGTRDGPPLLFRGGIACRPDQGPILARWLPRVRRIGGGRSRGLGRVTVDVIEDAGEALPTLGERLAQFDEAVRAEWRYYERVAGVSQPAEDERCFSVDLLAPAVLTRRGLPALCPALDDLGLPEGQVQLWRAVARQAAMGGWHMGGKLPRRTALATERGSVFLYRCRGLSLDDLEAGLRRLEEEGLGEERARGCGQVLISSPIHYQAEVAL